MILMMMMMMIMMMMMMMKMMMMMMIMMMMRIMMIMITGISIFCFLSFARANFFRPSYTHQQQQQTTLRSRISGGGWQVGKFLKMKEAEGLGRNEPGAGSLG